MKCMMLAGALLLAASPALADASAVLETYADIAQATYEDALEAARNLDEAARALLADPTEAHLAAAREAWLAARVPYQQTEVYRFGNPIVDDWEGRVNAWPLDEGLIDYVDAAYGDSSDENAALRRQRHRQQRSCTSAATASTPAPSTPPCCGSLHEIDGVEANVATGYHAIEFLLWGQDLNGTGPGAGNRPATDFDTARLHRRQLRAPRAYLTAATDLLVADLEEMVADWGRRRRGAAPTSRTARPRPASPRCSPAWARCPTASSPASA